MGHRLTLLRLITPLLTNVALPRLATAFALPGTYHPPRVGFPDVVCRLNDLDIAYLVVADVAVPSHHITARVHASLVPVPAVEPYHQPFLEGHPHLDLVAIAVSLASAVTCVCPILPECIFLVKLHCFSLLLFYTPGGRRKQENCYARLVSIDVVGEEMHPVGDGVKVPTEGDVVAIDLLLRVVEDEEGPTGRAALCAAGLSDTR